MAETIEQAQRELANIGVSFNRIINQIRRSCIDIDTKRNMLEELNEMAFEIHHLTAFEKEEAHSSTG